MQHTLRILLFLAFLSGSNIISGQYRVQDIPDPKVNGQDYFVSNPDKYISQSTVAELNLISTQIEAESSAEYALVIVDDYLGHNDHEFALELFNTWGIGKKGADNGLLLFIAINRREYRFISGRGMEGTLPDAYLKRIGEKYIVPSFKADNYNEGLLKSSEIIAQVLTSPDAAAELRRLMPEVGPFWRLSNPVLLNSMIALITGLVIYLLLHFKAKSLIPSESKNKRVRFWAPIILGAILSIPVLFLIIIIIEVINDGNSELVGLKGIHYAVYIIIIFILSVKILSDTIFLRKTHKDFKEREDSLKSYLFLAAAPMLLLPLSWFAIGSYRKVSKENEGRFEPPDNSGSWERYSRNTSYSEQLLSMGQKKEEEIGSIKYEVWKNTKTQETKTIPWDLNYKYHICPKCSFRTLEKDKSTIIVYPSYSAEGKKEIADKCKNCDYHLFKRYSIIPKKVHASSSSSGGSSSGGYSGGSSSSSSGSWGGGSSGGGGAGGRW